MVCCTALALPALTCASVCPEGGAPCRPLPRHALARRLSTKLPTIQALLQDFVAWKDAPLPHVVQAEAAPGGQSTAAVAKRLQLDLPGLLQRASPAQLREALRLYQHDWCRVLQAQAGLPGASEALQMSGIVPKQLSSKGPTIYVYNKSDIVSDWILDSGVSAPPWVYHPHHPLWPLIHTLPCLPHTEGIAISMVRHIVYTSYRMQKWEEAETKWLMWALDAPLPSAALQSEQEQVRTEACERRDTMANAGMLLCQAAAAPPCRWMPRPCWWISAAISAGENCWLTSARRGMGLCRAQVWLPAGSYGHTAVQQ